MLSRRIQDWEAIMGPQLEEQVKQRGPGVREEVTRAALIGSADTLSFHRKRIQPLTSTTMGIA